MEEQTTVTAPSGADSITASDDPVDYATDNAQFRQEFLECNLALRQARAAGDKRAERRARRRRDHIGNDFVKRNKALGVKGATPFMNGRAGGDDDLVQAALLGLWEAFVGASPDTVDDARIDASGAVRAKAGWDPARGSFSSIAHMHIRGRVRRTVSRSESANVGMSYQTWTSKPRVQLARAALTEELGRTPTVAEIAKRAGVTTETVSVCLTSAPVSLQTLLSDSDGGTLEDVIPADTGAPYSGAAADMADEQLANIARGEVDYRNYPSFGGMPASQIAVTLLRNGLHDNPERTVYETAALLSIGRGGVYAADKKVREHLSAAA